LRNQGLFV